MILQFLIILVIKKDIILAVGMLNEFMIILGM